MPRRTLPRRTLLCLVSVLAVPLAPLLTAPAAAAPGIAMPGTVAPPAVFTLGDPPPPRQPFTGASQVAVSLNSACALRDRQVWCWGTHFLSPSPVAGLDDVDRIFDSNSSNFCVLHHGSLMCGISAHSSGRPVPGGSDGSAIAAGRDFTCALVDANLWCWGLDPNINYGFTIDVHQSTIPVRVDGMDGAHALVAGDNFLCALANDGVWCRGDNRAGQSGSNPGWAPLPVIAAPPRAWLAALGK